MLFRLFDLRMLCFMVYFTCFWLLIVLSITGITFACYVDMFVLCYLAFCVFDLCCLAFAWIDYFVGLFVICVIIKLIAGGLAYDCAFGWHFGVNFGLVVCCFGLRVDGLFWFVCYISLAVGFVFVFIGLVWLLIDIAYIWVCFRWLWFVDFVICFLGFTDCDLVWFAIVGYGWFWLAIDFGLLLCCLSCLFWFADICNSVVMNVLFVVLLCFVCLFVVNLLVAIVWCWFLIKVGFFVFCAVVEFVTWVCCGFLVLI